VEITIRRGPNAESLNQLQARIASGSLRGGQEESVEIMRVAFRYARLKIEAKGRDLYDPKSVGFSCSCVVHIDPYGGYQKFCVWVTTTLLMNFDDALSQLLVFALPLTRMSPPFQPMVISTTTYTKGFAEHFNWVIRFHRLLPVRTAAGQG
jgi:hypothetical protein